MAPDGQKLTLLHWALIAGCVLLAGGGNLLLRYGMSQMGSVAHTDLSKLEYALRVFTRPEILVALAAYVCSMFLWLAVLSMTEISVAYPIFVSAAFLLVMVVSAVWLHEQVTLMRVIGVAVVVLGISILSMSARN